MADDFIDGTQMGLAMRGPSADRLFLSYRCGGGVVEPGAVVGGTAPGLVSPPGFVLMPLLRPVGGVVVVGEVVVPGAFAVLGVALPGAVSREVVVRGVVVVVPGFVVVVLGPDGVVVVVPGFSGEVVPAPV